MMKAYEDTKDISPIYKEFQAYYAGSFQSDLNALFHSYCERTETDIHFLGFNRDDLVHLDMIKVDMDKQLLVWPDKHHMAWFSLGLWSIAVSDILVYSFYHDYSPKWEQLTRYPKFTGWNNYAVEPNRILTLLTDMDASVFSEIGTFIAKAGHYIIDDLSYDIADLLKLDEQDHRFIKDFLQSWLGADAKGMDYDPQCFLR